MSNESRRNNESRSSSDSSARDQLAHLRTTDRDIASRRDELLFQVMLWSLAVAVALGVLAALTASFDIVGRVAATATLTAIVAAMLWKMSGFVRPVHRSVGQLADVVCGAFYLFALAGIWEVGPDWKMWATAFSILATGVLAAGGWWQTSTERFRATGAVVAFASGPVLLLWLVAIWQTGRSGGEFFGAGMSLLGWMTPAALSLAGWSSSDRQHWRWIGVGASAVGLLLSLFVIFGQSHGPDWEKAIAVTGSIAAVVVHANLSLMAPLSEGQSQFRLGTLAIVLLCGVCFDLLVLSESRGDSLLIRFTIALAILGSGGTIAIAFMGKRNARRLNRTPIAGHEMRRELVIVCPECGAQQTLPTGRSQCDSCGLEFEIRIGQVE